MKREKRKVGVLIHGYAVQEKPRFEKGRPADWYREWQYVVWGQGSLMGRIPMGILTAMEQNADIIVFGTGASIDEYGIIEAEVIRDFAIKHFESLGVFDAFHNMPVFEDKYIETGKNCLELASKAETESKNTIEEIEYASKIFSGHGIDSIFFVSSPDHISRVAKQAWIRYRYLAQDREIFLTKLFFVSSDVPYTRTGPEGLVIQEPHDDRVKIALNK